MFQMPQIPHDKLSASGVERGICTSNSPSTSKASATQPLGLFAFDSCIITNTAGQAQLMGKPADTPAAVIASAVKQSIATSTTTDQVQANSGAIANNFDKDAVQSEIDLQVKVTQQFDVTRQQAKTIVNQQIDGLNKDIKALEDAKTAGTITADQDKLLTEKLAERDNWQIGGSIVDSIASGLSGPSSTGAAGILANAAAPQLQYQIGQYFKGTDAEGSTAHILAHTILAAAVAAAGGNDALMAGLAAGGAEAVAPAVANWLYGSNPDVKKDAKDNVIASELTAEQKNILSNIIGLGTAGVTGLAGGSVTDVVSSTGLAQTAVEDNYLTPQQLSLKRLKLDACVYSLEGYTPCAQKVNREFDKISYEQDIKLAEDCRLDPQGSACQNNTPVALDYVGDSRKDPAKQSDISDSRKRVLDVANYSGYSAINNIEPRADYFGAMYAYTGQVWFKAAEQVSRDDLQGAQFQAGNVLSNPSSPYSLSQWRNEAGVIPPKRAASKSRINTSPAFSAGRVSLLKPSYAFALE